MQRTLPSGDTKEASAARKAIPMFEGCLKYFPAALAGVARWSKIGNDKHNPGQPLHHARGKSSDHANCIIRHLMDIADLQAAESRSDLKLDWGTDILDEADALVWRALALSQELHERYAGSPLAPGARLPTPKPLAFEVDSIERRTPLHQKDFETVLTAGCR